MRSQSRVSRYFSSTASATSTRPESVDRPSAAANSAIQNSATSGAPGPANGRPVSPPPRDPGGRELDRLRRVLLGPRHRRDQHIGLSPVRRGPARSRANPSTAEAESRSGRVVVIPRIQPSTTDSPERQKPFCTREFSPISSRSLRAAPGQRRGRDQRSPARTRCVLGSLDRRSGLDCPLASLAARPPTFDASCRRAESWSRLSARWCSLLDHLRSTPAAAVTVVVSTVRSLRSLLDHLRSTPAAAVTVVVSTVRSLALAARPPTVDASCRRNGRGLDCPLA